MGRTHKHIRNRTRNGYQNLKFSPFQPLNLKTYHPLASRTSFRPIKPMTMNEFPPKPLRKNSLASTRTNSANSSILYGLESKEQEIEAPPYYLPKILKSIHLEQTESIDHKRYLNHFNFLRKCFASIHNLNTNRVPFQISEELHCKKILVLDLDETLVHTFEKDAPADAIKVLIKLFNMHEKTLEIKFRPFCFEFLNEACKMFDIFIFTASHKTYADPIIDLLDPNNSIFKGRLYMDSCTKINGIIVKDLRLFNRDLKEVIIVDNTASCWGLQKENGVPIICFKGQDDDQELIELLPFLEHLNVFSDVRKGIMRYFKWDVFLDLYRDISALVYQYLS